MFKALTPVILLTISNIFMTFAWYGHLRFKHTALWIVILISWLIAFVEYFISFKKTSDSKKEEIMEEIKKVELKSENHTNRLLVYLEMMDEPLACLFDDQYLFLLF